MVDHDGGYKRFFNEPRMVQDQPRNSPPVEKWRQRFEIPLRWRGICIPDIEHISDDLECFAPRLPFLLIDENAFSRKEALQRSDEKCQKSGGCAFPT